MPLLSDYSLAIERLDATADYQFATMSKWLDHRIHADAA